MDVIWGEDHEVLAKVARSVLGRYSPLIDRDRPADPREQVRQFAELDWLRLGDPNNATAEAAGLGSISAIFVEQGRALVQSPLLALTTARDTALLAGAPEAMVIADGIGDGSRPVAAVVADPAWGDTVPELRGDALTGSVLAVPYAECADAFVVLAHEDSQPVLVHVESGAGIEVEPQPNLGSHSLASVTFADTGGCSTLARGADAEHAVDLARQRAAVLLAAQVYGAGTRLLEMSVQYATQRHQFGGPIGRFQAVQYLCTDIALGIHLTSLLARDAAASLDRGEDASARVALLCKRAGRTAQEMVHAAHEVHAGMGFMVESDVHLFTKAARYWQFALETAPHGDRTVVAALDRTFPGGRS
jgi:alkylation response protein AidB-like acyl-CoA dehydrogenase